MKKIFIIFLLLSIPYYSYANMFPGSTKKGSYLYTLSGGLLEKNVSVEKLVLGFKTSSRNIFNNNAKYIGYEYLKKKENITQDFIDKNTISAKKGNRNCNDNGCDEKIVFFEPDKMYYESGSVDITVRYYLKNNSNKEINNGKVGFSFGKTNYIRGEKSNSGITYVLNNENDYPTNFKIYDGDKKITTNDNFNLEKYNDKFDGYISVNKVKMFNLAFIPNETKILTVSYSLPFKYDWFNFRKYIDYDFSPIYNWKNGVVKQVYIGVRGDDNNILNDYYTYIDINDEKLSYVSKNRVKKYHLNKVGPNKYSKYLENIDKRSNINNIKIFFTNQKDFIESSGWKDLCGYGTLFCFNEDLEDIVSFIDPQKVIFKYKNGTKRVLDIFDLLNKYKE